MRYKDMPRDSLDGIVQEFNRLHHGVKARVIAHKDDQLDMLFEGLFCAHCKDHEQFPGFKELLEKHLGHPVMVKDAAKRPEGLALVYDLEQHDPADDALEEMDEYYKGVSTAPHDVEED